MTKAARPSETWCWMSTPVTKARGIFITVGVFFCSEFGVGNISIVVGLSVPDDLAVTVRIVVAFKVEYVEILFVVVTAVRVVVIVVVFVDVVEVVKVFVFVADAVVTVLVVIVVVVEVEVNVFVVEAGEVDFVVVVSVLFLLAVVVV